MKKNFLFSFFVTALLFTGCNFLQKQETPPPAKQEIANPASVNCTDTGGKLDTRENESGNQYNVCVFDDNSECEEWAYLRGECKKGDVLPPLMGTMDEENIESDELVGGDCGTVTPDKRNECCENTMKDEDRPRCDGKWTYNEETGKCAYICDYEENAAPTLESGNPASTNCVKNGGTLEIRKDAEGNEAGYCVFADGSECEEWAYLRGECNTPSLLKTND